MLIETGFDYETQLGHQQMQDVLSGLIKPQQPLLPAENEAIGKLTTVLTVCAQNPQRLINMPYFPAAHYHDVQMDTTDLEEFAKKVGLNSYKDFFDTTVYVEDVLSAFTIDKHAISQYLHLDPEVIPYPSDPNHRIKTAYRLDVLLTQLSLAYQEQLYGQSVFQQAQEMVREYNSDFDCQKPSKIIIEYGWTHRQRAAYYGALRGTHYIALNMPADLSRGMPGPPTFFSNPYNNRTEAERMRDVLSIVHELFHQKHAEVVGQEAFLGINLDSIVSDDEFHSVAPLGLLQNVGIKISENGLSIHDSLTNAVKEGIAWYGEYMLCQDQVSKSETPSNGLQNHWAEIQLNFQEALDVNSGENMDGDGIVIVSKLIKEYGLTLTDIMRIDLTKCSKIKYNTATYHQVVQNPEQLLDI